MVPLAGKIRVTGEKIRLACNLRDNSIVRRTSEKLEGARQWTGGWKEESRSHEPVAV